jgi:hypothetical protein
MAAKLLIFFHYDEKTMYFSCRYFCVSFANDCYNICICLKNVVYLYFERALSEKSWTVGQWTVNFLKISRVRARTYAIKFIILTVLLSYCPLKNHKRIGIERERHRNSPSIAVRFFQYCSAFLSELQCVSLFT